MKKFFLGLVLLSMPVFNCFSSNLTTLNSTAACEWCPNLQGISLSDLTPGLKITSLKGASLKGAKLAGIDLSGADLQYTVLTDVDLTGANLSGANLSGALLENTILTGAILTGVTTSSNTYVCKNSVLASQPNVTIVC